MAVVREKPNRRTVELSDGTTVRIKPPGILYEEQVLGTFPDLLQYWAKREALEAAAKEAGQKYVQSSEDRQREYRIAILQVIYCSEEPRFTEQRIPERGQVSLDELTSKDFWKLSGEIQKLYEEVRAAEAEEVRPLSETEST